MSNAMTDYYIPHDAVKQIIAARCGECADARLEFIGFLPDCDQCLLHVAKKAIESIPAADVRPVVLCRDCKWYKESELLAPNKFCFRLVGKDGKRIGYNFSPEDFCSYGERPNCGAEMREES